MVSNRKKSKTNEFEQNLDDVLQTVLSRLSPIDWRPKVIDKLIILRTFFDLHSISGLINQENLGNKCCLINPSDC